VRDADFVSIREQCYKDIIGAMSQKTAKYKKMLINVIKIGISVWMLVFVLLYLMLSNTVYFFVYGVSQTARIPRLEEYFVEAREFLLHFFTASYLY